LEGVEDEVAEVEVERQRQRRHALPFRPAAAGDQEGDEARERERAAHRAADDGDERLTL